MFDSKEDTILALSYFKDCIKKKGDDAPIKVLINAIEILLSNKPELFQDAIFSIRQLVDNKHSDATFILGFLELLGHCLPKNIVLGASHIRDAARQKQANALCQLAVLHENGVIHDEDRGFSSSGYKEAAELNDMVAQYALSRCYRDGTIVKQDEKKADEFYQKAKMQLSKESLQKKEDFAKNCNDVALENIARGVKLVEISAATGHAFSKYLLGTFYQKGILRKKSDLRAIECYSFASLRNCKNSILKLEEYSTKGFPEADLTLSTLMAKNKNHKEYLRFLEKAAGKDYALAEYFLAGYFERYYKSSKKEEFREKALNCYQAAAKKGNELALVKISSCFKRGELGLSVDIKQALAVLESPIKEGSLIACLEYCLLSFSQGSSIKDFIKIAEKRIYHGDADIMLYVGMAYELGKDLPRDLRKAAQYFYLSAHAGNKASWKYLARCYWLGKGIEKDLVKAIFAYKKGLESTSSNYTKCQVQFDLACCYEEEGSETSLKKSTEYFQLAAAEGHAESLFELGMCYLIGKGVERNSLTGAFKLIQAANKKFLKAIAHLAVMYKHGIIVPRNNEKSIEYFQEAEKHEVSKEDCYKEFSSTYSKYSDDRFNLTIRDPNQQNELSGYKEYQYQIGKTLCFNLYMDRNIAVKYFMRAAAGHHIDSYVFIGILFESMNDKNNSYPRDIMHNYKLAADKGHPIAKYALSILYRDGKKGVPVSPQLAEGFFQEALNAFLPANENLPNKNVKLERELKLKARLNLYKEAAKYGHIEAIFCLGHFYETGLLVERNDELAAKKYVHAMQYGHKGALEKLKQLSENNNPVAQFHYAEYLFKKATSMYSPDVEKAIFYFDVTARNIKNTASIKYLEILSYKHQVPLAQFTLASILLDRNEIVANDINKAANLLRSAAGQYYAPAQYKLAMILLASLDKSDMDEGLVLLKLCAERGDGTAHDHLAFCYENAIGVSKNMLLAQQHYKIAADFGNIHAMQQLNMIEQSNKIAAPIISQLLDLVVKNAKEKAQKNPLAVITKKAMMCANLTG